MKIKSKLLKPLFMLVALIFGILLILGTLATFKLSPLQAWHDSENSFTAKAVSFLSIETVIDS